MQILNEVNEVDVSSLPPSNKPDINAAIEMIKDGTLSVDDEKWNDVFISYLAQMRADAGNSFVYLKASKNLRGRLGAPNAGEGYIKYTSRTGTGREKSQFLMFERTIPTINVDEVTIVDDAKDASIFKESDVNEFIQALKKNKDFKTTGITFKTIKVPDNIVNIAKNPAENVFKKFLTQKAGTEDILSWLSNIEKSLFNISRPRQHPLVGNGIIDVFVNAFRNDNIRNVLTPIQNTLVIINDLVADREMSSAALKNPKSFLATLAFNPKLSQFPYNDARDIWKLYRIIDRKAQGQTANVSINDWAQKKDQLARNLIITKNVDEDNLPKLISDNDVITTFEDFGTTPEDNRILTYDIRKPLTIEHMMEDLFPETEENSKPVLSIVLNNSSFISFTGEADSGESLTFVTKPKEFKENDIIKFVYVNENAEERVKIKQEGIVLNPDTPVDPNLVEISEDKKSIKLLAKGIFKISGEMDLDNLVIRELKITKEEKQVQRSKPKENNPEPIEDEVEFDEKKYIAITPEGSENIYIEAGDWFVGEDGNMYQAQETRNDYRIHPDSKIYIDAPKKSVSWLFTEPADPKAAEYREKWIEVVQQNPDRNIADFMSIQK